MRLNRLAVALSALTLTFAAQAQTKWDMATAYPASNYHTENIQQFANDIEKATGGKLKITVHANASLFKAPEIKRAVQGGQTQMGEIFLSSFENENPLFGIDGIPFLATSYGQAQKLYKVSRKAQDDLFAKHGMKILFSVPWPPSGIYSKKPLDSIADMRGVKWRAYSPATSRIAELAGAQPVTVQAAELSQALATGVVDSFLTSGATGYDAKVYEQVKNFYDTRATLPKNAVIVNKRAFNALDKATQDAVLKAASDAETRGWTVSSVKNDWYLTALKEKGMAVSKPSNKMEADLKQIGDVMLADWLKKTGAEGQAVIDAYRK